MNEFKIGDKVRLRDDLEVGRYYGGVRFLSGMKDLQGKELTIDYIDKDGDYGFEESGYVCSEEMLKKVFNDSDLLEFALDKLGISKEELEEEYEKNSVDEKVVEDIKKRSDDFKNYCGRFCSKCDIYKFKERNNLRGLGDRNCIMIYEHLFKK